MPVVLGIRQWASKSLDGTAHFCTPLTQQMASCQVAAAGYRHLRVLHLEDASGVEGVVSPGNDLGGIAETERQIPAMDIVETLVISPGFLCVKDLEDTVRGNTYAVLVFVELRIQYSLLWLLWLDRAQIKPCHFGHRIFLRWRGGQSDFVLKHLNAGCAVPNSIAHRPVPVPMSSTL